MLVATWNVNSIRSRIDLVKEWIDTNKIDILCLQETKTEDKFFPIEIFSNLGYEVSISGQKSYNGVAIISRFPINNIKIGFDEVIKDYKDLAILNEQKRIISAEINDIRIVNVYVPNGYVLLGADATGLELRCLSHFLHRYDDGAYSKILLEGDIHSANQKAAGLETRQQAKTFIYGFLYGAGEEKIGQIIGRGSKEGRIIKNRFLQKTPALKKLKEAVNNAAKKGWIKGLDDRQLPIRHAHAALNTLLQSAGALICKRWYINIHTGLLENGFTEKDASIVAFIHDEVQLQVRKGLEQKVGDIIQQAMQSTRDYYDFNIRLDSEWKSGENWADTH